MEIAHAKIFARGNFFFFFKETRNARVGVRAGRISRSVSARPSIYVSIYNAVMRDYVNKQHVLTYFFACIRDAADLRKCVSAVSEVGRRKRKKKRGKSAGVRYRYIKIGRISAVAERKQAIPGRFARANKPNRAEESRGGACCSQRHVETFNITSLENVNSMAAGYSRKDSPRAEPSPRL